ncbi:MAG: bis(5'-nucleosyl)-tetraphosphatase (symmetrical) YqeK [Turicibacter sp.]|nr:bis(5'-nucleosyl)-tetraphosphatase (symmetrical) YqeK [Turicibacter sp.]
MINLETLKLQVKEQLPIKRYNHTLGVMQISEQLARRYNASIESAQIAALLHDIAKNLPNELLKEKLEEANESEYLNYSPLVWHAPVGAIITKDTYRINDLEILNAIKYHTTGRPAMTLLEKIVFLADYIEPNRTQPGVEKIRELAINDLDRAIAQTLFDTVSYLSRKGDTEIHPDTVAAYEYYRQYL